MAPSDEPQTSKSGIYTDTKTGERYIPHSVRADGSVRKEIKIRPGYKPPEDVEIYKNRTAEAWKNRGQGGVPGADPVEEKKGQSATANKNAKRREARKKAAAASSEGKTGGSAGPADKAATALAASSNTAAVTAATGGDTRESADAKTDLTGKSDTATTAEAPEPVDPALEKAKEAKKLAKKLRQARELKDKKEKGDKLLPEQFEKVIRINELIRQLDALGFDSNGEKKEEADG